MNWFTHELRLGMDQGEPWPVAPWRILCLKFVKYYYFVPFGELNPGFAVPGYNPSNISTLEQW